MQKQIELQNRVVDYTLKVSPRARHLRLSVYPGGDFVVTAPRFTTFGMIERFIIKKAEWVVEKIDQLAPFTRAPRVRRTKADYRKHQASALALATTKVSEWNKHYNFKYNRITIRNQKSRWGSCSKKGNLNFNYKIALLPSHLADYIVIHELCHLGEFNHSRAFWSLVAQTCPNYASCRQELRQSGRLF